MERGTTQRIPSWSGWVIAAATLAWVVAVYLLFGRAWDLGFTMSGEPLPPEVRAEVDARYRLLVIVLVAAPATITLFAAMVNRKWTALAYLVVTLALTCWAGSQEDIRDLFDRRADIEVEEPETDQCITISGSDRTCPGG